MSFRMRKGRCLYDHRRKIAWWMNARLVLELVVLPVMIVTAAAAFFFGRSEFEDTTALVTFAEIVCEAKKTHFGRPRRGLFETERIVLPCSSFKTPFGEGLQEQGYVLAKTSQIKVRFRSPTDNRLHEASVRLQSTDVSVNDRIRIGASKKDARSIRVDW
ncbi:hypothetical protein [Labrenzia sp. DG1229]|uniref:hypothetical protein n=1 Tax=Labrenzia sp. DG1229 TaxID=681847 RepID=UPI0012EC26BA|nr:hypothetical protein [Labrenzia sp. DG1229]